MFKIIPIPVLFVLLMGCKHSPKIPDVSAFKATVEVQRFDQDFFALDTFNLDKGLDQLHKKYPVFLPAYLVNILGVNPAAPEALPALKSFLSSYAPVVAEANATAIPAMPALQKEVTLALKLMQYYVPGYKPNSPFIITTFIGPMDAYEPFATGDYGDVQTDNGAGIALQLHLGAGSALYTEGEKSGTLYQYQTRRFTPEMMVVNTIKNLINDAFPYPTNGSATLVDDMIEKGKRLYLLQLLLPNTPDSLQLGYTAQQLKGCSANEALIWNYFVKNDLLYSTEPQVNQNYIKDGPKTPELGEGAPGYIGLFLGRQIVKKYMQKHPMTSVAELMKTPAATVFQQAGYKP